MKIIEHGKRPESPVKATRRFKCIRCGCVFEADVGEYECVPKNMEMFWRGLSLDAKYCSCCPECGAGAEEVGA